MMKTTIRTLAAASALALLAGCGGSNDANGGKDAAAPAGKAAWNAADACTLLDKGTVGAALQQDVAETQLSLVHEADGPTAATSECLYLGQDGASVARLSARWSPIDDNTAETIAGTRATTAAAVKAFSDTPVEDIPGLGKAAFFVPGINQLTVFFDDARMIVLAVEKAPDGAAGKDIALALARKVGA